MKDYQIGDFCKKTGVTPAYLKYQEQHGIVQPHLKNDSEYRYYKFAQAGRIYETLRYQNLGFSSREIGRIVSEKTADEIIDALTEKAFETEHEIIRLQNNLDFIAQVKKQRSFEIKENPYELRSARGNYFLPHSYKNDFYSGEQVNSLVQEWIELLPAALSTQRIMI